jgi:hypothetical protein
LAPSKPKKKEGSDEKTDDRSDFVRATSIPYLGFLLSQDTASESRGTDSPLTLQDGDLITKLVVGWRWMVYPRIAMNFSMRASYQKSSSTAKSSEEVGGSIDKLEIEARMLELSLFF